jgi:hypothetical protein
MVHITSVLLALVLSCPIGVIHAAPVNNTVDANTLLKNGQTAQNLNVAFNNLTINDPCQSGQEACVSGALAKCDNTGKWEAQQCPSNTQCFALPDIRSGGTKLRCTSQQRASTLIQASGAQGGVFGNNSTAGADSSNSSATQTVTVLVAPSATQTLNSQTTTLDSAGVSSLLASLVSSGVSGTATSSGTELNTAASATATSSGDAATTTDSGNVGAQGALATGVQGAAAAAAPTTIILSGSSSTATASSDPSSTPGASDAAESAPPSNGGYKF